MINYYPSWYTLFHNESVNALANETLNLVLIRKKAREIVHVAMLKRTREDLQWSADHEISIPKRRKRDLMNQNLAFGAIGQDLETRTWSRITRRGRDSRGKTSTFAARTILSRSHVFMLTLLHTNLNYPGIILNSI